MWEVSGGLEVRLDTIARLISVGLDVRELYSSLAQPQDQLAGSVMCNVKREEEDIAFERRGEALVLLPLLGSSRTKPETRRKLKRLFYCKEAMTTF